MSSGSLGLSLPLWTVVPFIGLILSIALLPLRAPRFWRVHHNKALVALLWAAPILILLLFRGPQELLHSVRDYISFILLLAAL